MRREAAIGGRSGWRVHCCTMPVALRFANYEEFFLFYLRQHSSAANRALHACGTGIGLAILIGALATRHFLLALLWIPAAYSFAWIGHLIVEGNKPASWGHPWWSFISDFRMLALMVTGRLGGYLARAEAVAPGE